MRLFCVCVFGFANIIRSISPRRGMTKGDFVYEVVYLSLFLFCTLSSVYS